MRDRELNHSHFGGEGLSESNDGRVIQETDVDLLASLQEETDSRVILYAMYGRDSGYDYVMIKSPDTDIFFILLHYALQFEQGTILFDTWTGNNKRIIDMTEIARGYTQDFCTALMSLHAFTGYDTTSAYKGMGKILQKTLKYVTVLLELGDNWEIPDQLYGDLAAFTCALHDHPQFINISDLRLFI